MFYRVLLVLGRLLQGRRPATAVKYPIVVKARLAKGGGERSTWRDEEEPYP